MKLLRILGFSLTACITLAACESYKESNPVIFGQTQNLGLNIGLSQVNQTPELSLGYRDFNIAILPTVARSADGSVEVIGGVQSGGGASGQQQFGDTYSVLGQFDTDGSGSASGAEAGLGKFFATGLAAQTLSSGFACSLSKGTQKNCTGNSTWSGN